MTIKIIIFTKESLIPLTNPANMNFKLILFAIMISTTLACGQEKKEERSALQIVNSRMELYNQHNFEDFIKLYAEDVAVYTYPDKLLGTGVENIISIFKPKFAAKSISVKIVNQMENGNHVINHEIVTEQGEKTKYVSIYEIENGLIKSVRFVRDH